MFLQKMVLVAAIFMCSLATIPQAALALKHTFAAPPQEFGGKIVVRVTDRSMIGELRDVLPPHELQKLYKSWDKRSEQPPESRKALLRLPKAVFIVLGMTVVAGYFGDLVFSAGLLKSFERDVLKDRNEVRSNAPREEEEEEKAPRLPGIFSEEGFTAQLELTLRGTLNSAELNDKTDDHTVEKWKRVFIGLATSTQAKVFEEIRKHRMRHQCRWMAYGALAGIVAGYRYLRGNNILAGQGVQTMYVTVEDGDLG